MQVTCFTWMEDEELLREAKSRIRAGQATELDIELTQRFERLWDYIQSLEDRLGVLQDKLEAHDSGS